LLEIVLVVVEHAVPEVEVFVDAHGFFVAVLLDFFGKLEVVFQIDSHVLEQWEKARVLFASKIETMLLSSLIENIVHQITHTFILSHHNEIQGLFRIQTLQVVNILSEVEHGKGLFLKDSPGLGINLIIENGQIWIIHILDQ